MKRIIHLVTLLTLISILSATSSFASDNAFKEVFQDTFYGGAVGALVGSAFMAFTKKPVDHLEDLGFGAGIGILAGATYGIAKSTRALAEIDNGRVRIAMPTLFPDLVESPVTKQTTITWRAEILRGTFN